jgi:hypothetical protein
MPFEREQMKLKATELAAEGVFIGTSSWKYEGWFNQLYTSARYEYRGKVATTRFERSCLAEYAEVFKTVCVDAAYYTFPSEKYLDGLVAQVPPDFRFGFKVTDEITVRKFPNLPRFGVRAGKANENFLNADLFSRSFLKPYEHIRANVGVVISGRKYEAAVKAFQPYDQTKEVNDEARKSGGDLIKEGKAAGAKKKTLIFVNNRLEGNALKTISAMIQASAPS